MNWIEINGLSSQNVRGLMINQLPSITKPAKRVNRLEIEGMDGDVIEDYGYESYDKEFEVSMLPNGNINDIIAFFDAEGRIMFSNEQGKYYRFKVIDRIDFERLIRFRRATVVIHVQPFKYSDEIPQELNVTGKTSCEMFNDGNIASRPVISIEGTGDIELSLNGNLVFTIDMNNNSKITIDTEKCDAYDTTNPSVLLNRKVTGNYDKFRLHHGMNTVAWSGTITKITTERTSRWI